MLSIIIILEHFHPARTPDTRALTRNQSAKGLFGNGSKPCPMTSSDWRMVKSATITNNLSC